MDFLGVCSYVPILLISSNNQLFISLILFIELYCIVCVNFIHFSPEFNFLPSAPLGMIFSLFSRNVSCDVKLLVQDLSKL